MTAGILRTLTIFVSVRQLSEKHITSTPGWGDLQNSVLWWVCLLSAFVCLPACLLA